jgi:hypothetical protein
MKLNEKIKKENPFRVPDGYFDSLADRTMDAIRKDEVGHGIAEAQGEGLLPGAAQMKSLTTDQPGAASTPAKSRIISMKPFFSLAAAILGFALLAAVTVRLVTADRNTEGYEPGASLYADLVFEELDAYMLENELFVTEQVTGAMPEEEISSEAIIEYLMTEDIDLNDIYELL